MYDTSTMTSTALKQYIYACGLFIAKNSFEGFFFYVMDDKETMRYRCLQGVSAI